MGVNTPLPLLIKIYIFCQTEAATNGESKAAATNGEAAAAATNGEEAVATNGDDAPKFKTVTGILAKVKK